MSATYPLVVLQPFADTGQKNTIPNTPNPTPGGASYEEGFPPLTMTPIQNGGVPPSGRDFNGILNELSQHTVWQNAGGLYRFSATLAAAIGGYSKGMVLLSDDGLNSYRSMVDNNSIDFNVTPASIGVQWEFYAGAAAGNTTTTVNTTGGNVTLTANQAAADIIIVTGVLASSSTITFPAIANRQWKLINATTGAFGMVAKAPTGQSLTMSQGFTNTVFYNGTELVFPDHDSGLDSPAFRGIPTVPTAAPGTSTLQAASTAFVTNAVAVAAQNAGARYVNSNFTVTTPADLWTDTGAGAFTITLPASPVAGNPVYFRDSAGKWDINNLTINRNGNTIRGLAENIICNTRGLNFGLYFDNVANTWKAF